MHGTILIADRVQTATTTTATAATAATTTATDILIVASGSTRSHPHQDQSGTKACGLWRAAPTEQQLMCGVPVMADEQQRANQRNAVVLRSPGHSKSAHQLKVQSSCG